MKTLHKMALAASLLAAACASSAATVKITFANPIFGPIVNSDAVSIRYKSQNGGDDDYTTASVRAGRFKGVATELDGISPSLFVDDVNNVFMYCYDLYEGISPGQNVRYTIRLDGETDRTLDLLGAVNDVLNRERGQSGATYDKFAWLHPTNMYQSAAIQLGIWESRFDDRNSWSLTGGDFKAWNLDGQSGAANAADGKTQWYVEQFFARRTSVDSVDAQDAMVLSTRGAQDMLTGDPPSSQVPEPGSLALAGLALAGLIRARRKAKA